MARRKSAPPLSRVEPPPVLSERREASKEPQGLWPDFGLIGSLGFGALLAALFLAPVIGGVPAGVTYGGDVALGALRCLILLAGLLCSGGNTARGRVGGSRIAVRAVAGLALLSLLVHSRFLSSPVLLFAMLPATLDWLCIALVVSLAASLAARDRRAFSLLTLTLIAGAAWVALVGVWQYRELAMTGNRAERISATFFSPNFAAGYLALCLPVAAAWFVRARENLAVFGLGAVTALMAGVLVATGSRASVLFALAGMGAALLLALLTGRAAGGGSESGRLPWGRIAALAGAIAVIGFAFRGPLTSRVSSGAGGGPPAQAHSEQFRAWTWKGTLAMARANPLLGAGPGTFPYRYPPYALVAKTDLAHSSYLQIAAEQGFPALAAALAALAMALVSGLARLFRRAPEDEGDDSAGQRLIACGLLGGLLAGAARSVFDSEWSLLGNALPFWAVVGLLPTPPATASPCLAPLPVHTPVNPKREGGVGESEGASDSFPPPLSPPSRFGKGARHGEAVAGGVGNALSLLLALFLLLSHAGRDTALQAARSSGARSVSAGGGGWPPDPDLLAMLGGNPEAAARVEPSGRRFYRLARFYERQGEIPKAIAAFEKSVQADPNSLQAWRALAEARAAAGDTAGASQQAWAELTRRHEGPVGQVRAIPELPETHPAFAYAALARDAAKRGETEAAAARYEKAAKVIENYSRTPPRYQQSEVAISGANLTERRQEVRALYEAVVAERLALPGGGGQLAEGWERRKAETLARLDAFLSAGTGE